MAPSPAPVTSSTACSTHAVPRLVYMSSLSVLHAAAALEGQVITEDVAAGAEAGRTWSLHPLASWRPSSTSVEAARTRGLPVVILRPAEIIGPGATFLTAGVAQRAGRTLVVLGNGRRGSAARGPR